MPRGAADTDAGEELDNDDDDDDNDDNDDEESAPGEKEAEDENDRSSTLLDEEDRRAAIRFRITERGDTVVQCVYLLCPPPREFVSCATSAMSVANFLSFFMSSEKKSSFGSRLVIPARGFLKVFVLRFF